MALPKSMTELLDKLNSLSKMTPDERIELFFVEMRNEKLLAIGPQPRLRKASPDLTEEARLLELNMHAGFTLGLLAATKYRGILDAQPTLAHRLGKCKDCDELITLVWGKEFIENGIQDKQASGG